MWHAVIFSHLQYEWGSGSLMLLLIENKQRDGDFLTRLPCMIYDSECSEDKGSINVIWPFQPRVTVVTLFWPWIVISQKAVGISINCMILLHNTLISVGFDDLFSLDLLVILCSHLTCYGIVILSPSVFCLVLLLDFLFESLTLSQNLIPKTKSWLGHNLVKAAPSAICRHDLWPLFLFKAT